MYSKCNKSVTSETCDINASNCDVTLGDFDAAKNVEILSNDTCPECTCICIENPVRFCDKSIECSKCLYWYHLACVDLTLQSACVKNTDTDWFCEACSREN